MFEPQLDSKLIQSITPDSLRDYLRAHGWKQTNSSDVFTVWAAIGQELIVPSQRASDYGRRLAEIILEIQKKEERSQTSILRDIVFTGYDVIRLRSAGPDTENGTISCRDGADLFKNAHDMLQASACASVVRKPIFTGKKPSSATQYMDRARIGQTEHGSFVLTLLSPISPEKEQADYELPLDQPFGRTVTTTFSQATAKLSAAAAKGSFSDLPEEVESFVSAGVSSNLCDAMAGLIGDNHGRTTTIDISWSSFVSRPPQAASIVTIKPEFLGFLQDLSGELKKSAPLNSCHVMGYVVALARGEGENIGRVTVAGLIAGRHQKVSFDLFGDEYRQAISAHERGIPVSFIDDLTSSVRMLRAPNPREFTVLDSVNLFDF